MASMTMTMKKYTIILALSLLMAAPAPLRADPEPGRLYKVGMLQITDNPSLDEGFHYGRKRFKESGYVKGENLRIIRRMVLGDTKGFWNQIKILNSLMVFADEMIEEKVDVVVLATSPVFYLTRSKFADAGIPVVFGALMNPQALGCESSEYCGDLVTGATFYVDPRKIVNMIRAAFPKARRVCSIVTVDFDAMHRLDDYKKTFEGEEGLDFVGESVASLTGKGFMRVAEEILPECDVYIGIPDPILMIDNYSVAMDFMKLANSLNVPVISILDIVCRLGAPLALGVSPRDHGKQVADLAIKILNGAKPGDLPIRPPRYLNFYINPEAIRYLGLRLPASILANAKRAKLFPFIESEKVFPPK